MIGMGAGDPAFVTVQAVDAINAVDVFFVIDKGEAKEDLVAVRQDVLNRYATPRGYRSSRSMILNVTRACRTRTPSRGGITSESSGSSRCCPTRSRMASARDSGLG